MIDVARAVALTFAGTVAFVLIFVLPGVRAADVVAGRRSTGAPRLALSVVFSQLIVGGTGLGLIAIGRFSGLAVAIVAVVAAVMGVPVVARWVRTSGRERGVRGWTTAAWLALSAMPWIAFVGLPAWPPADTLQWYYDGLGRQLSAAGGIPSGVAEWGTSLRWLPDYLVFNIDSEAYLALLGALPRADALAAFRIPVALLGIAFVFVLLRLWIGRAPAIAGTTAIAGSVFFLAKFDAYKPEAIGIVVGLAAGWLILRGLRGGRTPWILVGGAAFGLDLSIHAIAAVVTGLAIAGFALGEWLGLRHGRRGRAIVLGRAAILGLLLSVAMGIAVQGRANVAPAALNPTTVGGSDPTWTFFLRSTGNFVEPAPLPPQRPLAGGVTTPWAGLRVNSAFGWWFLVTVAMGVAAGVAIGSRRFRTGAVGYAIAAGLVGAGVAFFAVRFGTYVPRWTGLVRFGQYAPLAAGIGVALALAGGVRVWSWLSEARLPRGSVLVVAVAGLVWLVPTAFGRYAAERPITEPGLAALAELRERGRPGDIVVSNVLTTGTIESFTGLEDPLEGRQPLIEEPAVLASANQLLLDAHAWFEQPSDTTFVDRLGASWVLVADRPEILGGDALVGGSTAASTAPPGLERVWSSAGVTLLRAVDPQSGAAVHDSKSPVVDIPRAAFVSAASVALAGLLIAPRRLLRRRVVREADIAVDRQLGG